MSYFMNFLRYPSPGKTSAVLEAVIESVVAVGRPGNVAVPVSVGNPTIARPAIVSLVGGFQTLDLGGRANIVLLIRSIISTKAIQTHDKSTCLGQVIMFLCKEGYTHVGKANISAKAIQIHANSCRE